MEAGGKTVSFDLGRPGDGSYQTDQIASIAKRHPGLKNRALPHGAALAHRRARSKTLVRMAGADSTGDAPKRLVRSFCAPHLVGEEEENPRFPIQNAILTWHAGSWEQRNCYGGQIFHGCWGTANYQQLVAHGKFPLSDCTEKEREMIFAENAWDVY